MSDIVDTGDQESGFLSFLGDAALTAIDAFVGRQQVRVQQPTAAQIPAVLPTRPAISTNVLIVGAVVVGVVLFAVSR